MLDFIQDFVYLFSLDLVVFDKIGFGIGYSLASETFWIEFFILREIMPGSSAELEQNGHHHHRESCVADIVHGRAGDPVDF
jgi:hypothetical protein